MILNAISCSTSTISTDSNVTGDNFQDTILFGYYHNTDGLPGVAITLNPDSTYVFSWMDCLGGGSDTGTYNFNNEIIVLKSSLEKFIDTIDSAYDPKPVMGMEFFFDNERIYYIPEGGMFDTTYSLSKEGKM